MGGVKLIISSLLVWCCFLSFTSAVKFPRENGITIAGDSFRAKALTVEQIADQLSDEDGFDMSGFSDDSYDDADWNPKNKADSSSGSEAQIEAQMDAGDCSDCSEPAVQDAPGVSAEPEIQVFMCPPALERNDADTDVDSDDPDNPTGASKHVARRLLTANAQLRKRVRSKVTIGKKQRLVSQDDSDDEEEAVPAVGAGAARRQPAPARPWSRVNSGLVGSNIPEYTKPVLDEARQSMLDDLSTAYDYYKLFQPQSFAEEIVYQSKLYAVQKDLPKQHLINVANYRCTEAALLLSGYNAPPRRRMMWEQKGDCYNTLVASNVRRDTVDTILRSLHFRDNTKITEKTPDIYFKVRPPFQNLNKHGHWLRDLSEFGQFSVDEVMIPYYGRHSTKQYIKGKPVRYGYKTWALCTSDGSYIWFEPYCGSDTRIEDFKNLGGQGPNVVLDLVSKEKGNLAPGSHVFMDNLFTSVPLLDELSGLGIGGTGTVRQNRLHKIPLKSKKEMESKDISRGYYEQVFSQDQVVVAWRDNKPVYVNSNHTTTEPVKHCSRYSRTEKKKVQVPIPNCVVKYNEGMGGVDLLDNLVSCYRVQWRIQKWWWPFYPWSLSVSAVNAWRLRNIQRGFQEPYLDFLRELVNEMLITHGSAPSRTPPVPTPSTDTRTDKYDHWLVDVDWDPVKQSKVSANCILCYRKKAGNGKTTTSSKTGYKCSKCQVNLHAKCFLPYHQ